MLEGKNAVITGGGRGIGTAIARDLAERGVGIVVSARSQNEIEEVAAEIRDGGGRAAAVTADVADPEQVAQLARKAQEFGDIDILVNNAGIASSSRLSKVSLDHWNKLFAVNVTGTFLCTQAFVDPMAARGWGRVVNVASIAGRMGGAYLSAYAATKHAMVGFTRAVAIEYATTGVTVNAVAPGYVETALVEGALENITAKTGLDEESARASLEQQSPQRRIYAPEEVAYVVASLCDGRAAGVNGQCWVIDGGSVQA